MLTGVFPEPSTMPDREAQMYVINRWMLSRCTHVYPPASHTQDNSECLVTSTTKSTWPEKVLKRVPTLCRELTITTPKTHGTYQFVPDVSLTLGPRGKGNAHQQAGPGQRQQGGRAAALTAGGRGGEVKDGCRAAASTLRTNADREAPPGI